MSQLEELVYLAFERGLRDQMFEQVKNIKETPEWKYKSLQEIYQEAYERVVKQ